MIIVFYITCPLDHLRRRTVLNLLDIMVLLLRILVVINILTVTQSIEICNHLKVSTIGQSLMLALTHTQYSFKIESTSNIVTWRTMIIDSLM